MAFPAPLKPFYMPCPFHRERTPSCRVWPGTGHFKCYGCGAEGGALEDDCPDEMREVRRWILCHRLLEAEAERETAGQLRLPGL